MKANYSPFEFLATRYVAWGSRRRNRGLLLRLQHVAADFLIRRVQGRRIANHQASLAPDGPRHGSLFADLTLRCPTCGVRADMCFVHGEEWKKRPRSNLAPVHRMTDHELRAGVNEFTQDDPPPYGASKSGGQR